MTPPVYLRVRILLLTCLSGLCLPVAGYFLNGESNTFIWLLDLAVHWQWLYVLGLCLSVALAVGRNPRWLLCLLACGLPWWTASREAPVVRQGPGLHLASANVHLSTSNTTQLAPWLHGLQPDVVILLEVSPALAGELKKLQAYPHQVVFAEESPFGIALLSRQPLRNPRIVPDEDGIVHLEAGLTVEGQEIHLAALHPMPPLSAQFHDLRDQKLQRLIRQAKQSGQPAIIAGDLNASPWSSAMRTLSANGWARATSLAASWPQWGLGVLGIPIDQVLVSADWGVETRQVGPPLGSDHLPVSVRLRLRPAVASAG